MQFAEEPIRSTLHHVVMSLWKQSVDTYTLLGKGVYGQCYGVTFRCTPYRAVVKFHGYPDVGKQEQRQLIELHQYFPTLVPRVYGYVAEKEVGDALVMQWLSGQSCPRPELFSQPLRASLQQQVVDLLVNIHSVQHPQGYGSFDGPYYLRWWDYYGKRVQATYQAIVRSDTARAYLGEQVLALMKRTLTYGERIVATSTGQPVLLHGDFCFGNLLFDAQRISGLIDPLDAEWGDRELDLVNIINGHIHHFELLNKYRSMVDLNECFPLRYWFYQLWTWLSYYVRVGTPCREWVTRCGRELEKLMVSYF